LLSTVGHNWKNPRISASAIALCVKNASRAGSRRQPGTNPRSYPRCGRDYAAFLNSSNRRASRPRSGRSSFRRGSWITCPTIPLRPSSRNGPSRIFEQPIGDVNSVVGVNPDQVRSRCTRQGSRISGRGISSRSLLPMERTENIGCKDDGSSIAAGHSR
jgi:hypothetical protein